MNDKQSLANQLGWSITTKDILVNLISEIQYIVDKYNIMVNDLSDGGYFAEMLNEIKQMKNEFEYSAIMLIKHIEQEHLQYIENQKKSIIIAINKFNNK